jgi:hypothetical protein
MRSCAAALAIVLATAGVADAAPVRSSSGAAEARAAVQADVGDPDAAFERVSVGKDAVCGVVEAKNARGAHTGRMLFVYVRAERKAYVLNAHPERGAAADEDATAKYQDYCRR